MSEATSTYFPGEQATDGYVIYPVHGSYQRGRTNVTDVIVFYSGKEQRRDRYPAGGQNWFDFQIFTFDQIVAQKIRDFQKLMKGQRNPFWFFAYDEEYFYREAIAITDGTAVMDFNWKATRDLTELFTDGVVTTWSTVTHPGLGGEARISGMAAQPAAPAISQVVGGGSLSPGAYTVSYTFVISGRESAQSAVSNSVTVGASDRLSVTGIAVGPTGTTARKVYRTTAGGGTRKLDTTISDNVTTIATLSQADGSLGANAPVLPANGSILTATFYGRRRFVVKQRADQEAIRFFAGGATARPLAQFQFSLQEAF